MTGALGDRRDLTVGAPGSELRLRIISGAVLVVLALGATWAGGWLFAALWSAAGIAIAYEWMTLTAVESRSAVSLAAGAGILALVVGNVFAASPPVLWSIAVIGLLAVAALARGGVGRAWAVTGFAYAGTAAVVPLAVRDGSPLGIMAMFWMFAVVWTTDVAAFFVGRAVGGPKLWPRVSPKKTWSGFVGGLAAATAAATAVAAATHWIEGSANLGLLAVFSALASIASQFGDLGESYLKRLFGVKDSGWLIPGHGGVLDRLDGFVAVAFLVGLVMVGLRILEH